jgi:predicted nucleotidyltransferase
MALVNNKHDLLAILKSHSSKLKSYGVSRLSVFGSFASGNPTPQSDVDFLVESKPEQKTYDNFVELSFYLEDLLGRSVEIVTPQSLSKHLGPGILDQAEHVAL